MQQSTKRLSNRPGVQNDSKDRYNMSNNKTTSYDSVQVFYNMVCDLADHLRENFQYGETVRGHMVENRELRKQFNKLNDLTAQIDALRAGPDFTGLDPSLIEVLDGVIMVFSKFEARFETIGLADHNQETMIRLRAVRLGLVDVVSALRPLQFA